MYIISEDQQLRATFYVTQFKQKNTLPLEIILIQVDVKRNNSIKNDPSYHFSIFFMSVIQFPSFQTRYLECT